MTEQANTQAELDALRERMREAGRLTTLSPMFLTSPLKSMFRKSFWTRWKSF